MTRLTALFASGPLVFGLLSILLMQSANARNIASLPACATACAIDAAAPTGCTLTDVRCLCRSQSFIAAMLSCLTRACSTEDQSKAIGVIGDMCSSATTSSSFSSSSSSTKPTLSPPISTRGPPTSVTSAASTDTSLPLSTSSILTTSSSSSTSTITTSSTPTTSSIGTTIPFPPTGSTVVVLTTSTLGSLPMSNAAASGLRGVGRVGVVGAVIAAMLALL
ncbi:hypothetical protein FPV67DRAFT_1132404 [Lyophyllum atratum]|nr:hypothetical protein FPV67DRAFT_1132404 [Lyophyllum atratum]